MWGNENEKVALKQYADQCHPGQVLNSGLIISIKWPWIAGNPNGLILQQNNFVGGIEIKCPYSKLDMTVAGACQDKNIFYVNYSKWTISEETPHELLSVPRNNEH